MEKSSNKANGDSLPATVAGRTGQSRGARLRVALLYNLASNAPPLIGDAPADALDELDHEENVASYAAALRAAGHEVFPMEGDLSLPAKLRRLRIDIAFNTCEGFRGDAREAQVPALLEMIGMPYTAARVTGSTLTLDKAMTKRVLAAELGTVSETFSRTLAKFREQKLITVKGKLVTVLDPFRLTALLRRYLGE